MFQIQDEIMHDFVADLVEEGNNNEANQPLIQQPADNYVVEEGFSYTLINNSLLINIYLFLYLFNYIKNNMFIRPFRI